MKKIKIQEILKNQMQTGEWDTCQIYIEEGTSGLLKAIKEIVDAVVDECAKKATIGVFTKSVSKQSILQVKQMIDYETE